MSEVINVYQTFKEWIKAGKTPFARFAYHMATRLYFFNVPAVKPLYRVVYFIHRIIIKVTKTATRVLYWTPIFKSMLINNPKCLYLYGGLPLVMGPVEIQVGSKCCISGESAFIGRQSKNITPKLIIGENVHLGYKTVISVGSRVVIGDNSLLSSGIVLTGFPGHPLDPEKRAKGLPDDEDQIGDIILEKNVWLASGVKVMAGVRIGEGTVIAAGSIVTHDLPSRVLAGGIPAKVIRNL